MNIIFKKIKKIYFKFIFFSPKLLSTITFIPFLYLCGWVLATPILLLSLDKEKISLIGTIFTFLIFIFSLPKWFEIRWGLKNIWELLGVKKTKNNGKLIHSFIKGLFLAIVLLSLILIPIVGFGWGYWIGKISLDILINAIFLLIGVGFAEELVFRGWLLEELKNQFGLKKAILAQASIFSAVHVGFDLPFWEMIGILTGLFFLGILLSLLRLNDNNSLWGSIGLHGGLVGIWFFINNGLIEFKENTPSFLAGPFTRNIPNPIGSFSAILILLLLCIFYTVKSKKIFTRRFN